MASKGTTMRRVRSSKKAEAPFFSSWKRRAVERELLIHGGTILTMDSDRPSAEALLSVGGRIAYVGETKRAQTLAGTDAVRIDLRGSAEDEDP